MEAEDYKKNQRNDNDLKTKAKKLI